MATITTTTDPSWLPWSTFVAIILLNRLLIRKQRDSTSLQKEVELQEASSEPFPWEPNTNTPPQETAHQTSNNTRAEEQLQFLACMTFANGGLRSPSCPCCQ